MNIIDAHVHLSHIHSFKKYAKYYSNVDYSLNGLKNEMKNSDVVLSIGMGLKEVEGGGGFPDSMPSTPMDIDMLTKRERNIFYCVGINPYRLGSVELRQLEKSLLASHVVGIKIYLGDFPFYAYDHVYEPIYELAKAYRLPVIFHTGNTYSENGFLQYSHPLTIDKVATRHKDVYFIMSNIGFPWLIDAAAVMMKNENVFAILSNLVSGDERKIKEQMMMKHYIDFLKQGFSLCDPYNKLIFGSNWPFVPVKPYIQFIQHIFPVSAWDDIFFRTAINVFSKLKGSVHKWY